MRRHLEPKEIHMTNLTSKELLEIVSLVESTPSIVTFRLRQGDMEIALSKAGSDFVPSSEPRALQSSKTTTPAVFQSADTAKPAPMPSANANAPAQVPAAEEGFVLKASTVGTFYAAKEPGASPFVSVGQKIEADTTVCIIEVMKIMNTIQAGIRGTVARILVEDGQNVEFGQPLMVITPT